MPSTQGTRPSRNCNKNKEIDLPDIESIVVSNVEERLATLPDQPVAATIFKVPHTITIGQPEAYKPKFLSIGPFNHHRNFPEKHQTKAAETHKIRYLRDFLNNRDNDQPCEFKDYVGGILALEGKARNCYSEEISLSSEGLVEGMVLDACFIIELFLKMDNKDRIAEDDPIYSTRWLIENIAYDLLLLENQVPFFILEDVYKRFNEKRSSCKPLTDLAMNFFRKCVPRDDAKVPVHSDSVHHLLHVVFLQYFVIDRSLSTSKLKFPWECNFFPCRQRQRSSDEPQLPTHQRSIPSATQLHDAGVKFSKGKNTNFLAIEFNNGRLEIPPFFLDGSSNSFLRNLIAFEQCFPQSTKTCIPPSARRRRRRVACGLDLIAFPSVSKLFAGRAQNSSSPQSNRYYSFTLYAYFMDRLVNTEKDIEILSKSGIIQHALGSDEEAAVFFNKLCTGLVINFEDTFQLGEICKQLNEYYRFRIHRWRTTLMHDYFNNPWSILSPVAALLLLALTLIQTTYSVLSYVKLPK